MARAAHQEAREMMEKFKGNDSLVKKLEAIAPAQVAAGGGGGRGGGGEETPSAPTLGNIAGQLVAAVMPMQGSEMPPTAATLAACMKQEAAYTALMAKWTALKASAK
jgi:hypothetical protein